VNVSKSQKYSKQNIFTFITSLHAEPMQLCAYDIVIFNQTYKTELFHSL